VTGSPFSIGGGADGIYINSSGNILYVADIFYQKIIALSVASDGSLSHITGSPFSYMASETLVASIILSSSTIGLVGTTDGMLSSYSIDATTGAPTLLHILSTGEENNQAVTTARDGSLAILSGGESPFISVVNVAADGTLTNVTGSPFSTSANTLGYAAANPAGTFLYATENTQIEGFSIDTNGVLTSLGTFPLTNANFARCLVIY
jgi:6-phosphogluconolactonase (cycloisomerase 2 family)